MTTSPFPTKEAESVVYELTYWAQRVIEVANGRGQCLPVPCPMLGLRQCVVQARELVDQALVAIDSRCQLPPQET